MLCCRGSREDFYRAGSEAHGGILRGEMLTQFLCDLHQFEAYRDFLPFTFYSAKRLRLREVLLMKAHQLVAFDLVDPGGGMLDLRGFEEVVGNSERLEKF